MESHKIKSEKNSLSVSSVENEFQFQDLKKYPYLGTQCKSGKNSHPFVDETAVRSHSFSALRVFWVFAFAYALSYLLRTINAVIAPELISNFGLSLSQLGWMTSLYFAAFALMQLPLGTMIDVWGAKKVNVSLLLIACCGCLFFVYSGSFVQLAIARTLIGLGVSGCLMCAIATF